MKSFFQLLRQDFTIFVRNGFHWALIAVLIMVFVLMAVLPEQMDVSASEYFLDESADQMMAQLFETEGAEPEIFVADRLELDQKIAEAKSAVGIIFSGSIMQPAYEIIVKGNIPDENVEILIAALDGFMAELQGQTMPMPFDVELLRPEVEAVPLNKTIVPIFVVFEAILLGFMSAALIIFQEKEEGTIRAYRVTPAGTARYLMSKNSLFVLLGVVYALVVVIFGIGFDLNFSALLFIVILGTSFYTLLGIGLSVFYNSINDFFFMVTFVLILNMLPVISYSVPTFAPWWVKIIPTYPIIFSVREILFPTGVENVLQPVLWLLILGNLIAFGFSYLAVKNKLMKEA